MTTYNAFAANARRTNHCALPAEIWSQIIREFQNHRRFLTGLCFVCKLFKSEAQRIIFQTLHLNQWKLKSRPQADVRRFFNSLALPSSTIAHSIYTLHLYLITSAPGTWEQELNDLCIAAVCAMSSLRQLHLISYKLLRPAPRPLSLMKLALKATFQLYALETDIGEEAVGFAVFVRSQRTLRTIAWKAHTHSDSGPPPNVIFESHDLPALKALTISCSMRLSKVFLPHCSITHLQLINGHCHCIEFDCVSPSVRALLVISTTRSQLATLSRAFPCLEYLELGRPEALVSNYDNVRPSFVDGELFIIFKPTPSEILAFPSLVKLKVWKWSQVEVVGQIGWNTAAQDLLSSASLSCIDIIYQTGVILDAVPVVRVQKPSGLPSTVQTKTLSQVSFEEYSREVEKWNGTLKDFL